MLLTTADENREAIFSRVSLRFMIQGKRYKGSQGASLITERTLLAVGWNTLLDALKRKLATASTHPYQVCTCHMCSSGSLLPELLGKPDENSFGAPDVAEPIRVFVLDHFADELRAAFAEPGERIVDVLHGEHDA